MPTLRITAEQLPAIKDWNVKKKYSLLVEVEMTGLNNEEQYDWDEPMPSTGGRKKKEVMTGTFEVTSVKNATKDPSNMSKKELDDYRVSNMRRT